MASSKKNPSHVETTSSTLAELLIASLSRVHVLLRRALFTQTLNIRASFKAELVGIKVHKSTYLPAFRNQE